MGLRVLSVDRPGFGRSTFVKNRTFRDFAKDVETLVTALDLKTLAVWGYSVGCAYATVCCQSRLIRSRLVAKTTFVSPWVPLTAPGVPVHFSVARLFPRSVAEILKPNDVVEKRAELTRRGTEASSCGGAASSPLSGCAPAKTTSGVTVDVIALSAPSARLDRLGLSSTPSKTTESSWASSVLDVRRSFSERHLERGGERGGGDDSPLSSLLAAAASSSSSSPPKKQGSVSSPSGLNFLLCGSGFFQQQSVDDSVQSSEDDYGELSQVEIRALEMLPRGPRVLLASVIESQRQGARGFSDEFRLCCSDFDFEYRELAWPARVYHGTHDNLVSTASVRWLVSEFRARVPTDDVELFQVLGGTHNGMVFAILKRSLAAVANDVTTQALAGVARRDDHLRTAALGEHDHDDDDSDDSSREPGFDD